MRMATIFTMIINGDIPGTFVHRDDKCVVFMSINPISRGHALVVPIDEVDHWLDASAELQAHLFEVAAKIGRAQQSAFNPGRIALLIAGFEVPHCHLHVLPAESEADISFANAAAAVDRDDLESAADAIRQNM
ncbi:MAG: histidine triad (HIT) family protein [Candidatus Poriferisodalaceae bacterium]|jgi:histidine triad (HIT) family protein